MQSANYGCDTVVPTVSPLAVKNFISRILTIVYVSCLYFLSTSRNDLKLPFVKMALNFQLIVAPWKFDVLKTNICPRSKAIMIVIWSVPLPKKTLDFPFLKQTFAAREVIQMILVLPDMFQE